MAPPKLVQASDDPEKILTTPTEPVEVQPGTSNEEARKIQFDLRLGIRLNPHLVGLAANQIGIKKSICLVSIGHEDKKISWITMVNPKITESSLEKETDIEGCGSIQEPEKLLYYVTRPREITVSFYDVSGEHMGVMLRGFSARVAQHEIDHLNGILISDHGRLVPNL